ncbi:MAG TPA: four helix bundle protein [Chitinophagaceae bacterium]|nr:four helix bundle protein [Chitinophagaceae bacterium]
MGRSSMLKTKSFDFAVRIIKLHKFLKKDHNEYDLSRQILRSGTSVGAIIREAEHAESKLDFVHKFSIGLKEINECIYWLDLLHETEYINMVMYESLKQDGETILKMLVASIKTVKARIGSNK